MKKRVFALLAACTVTAALVLGGCGQTQTTPDSGNTTGNQGASADDGRTDSDGVTQGYMFESNGVKIAVDVDMNEIKDSLGEPKSVFEEPSCAAQGTAYLYSYSGYEINTYPDGELNRIAYILLKDDTVATMEGVDLSMTREDVIAAYGDDYEGDDKKISYEKDGMTLNFMFDGDSIISIEYDSGVLN